MIDPLLSLANTVYSNKGVFAVLLGSGISRAASVPTGWEVTLDLIRHLSAMKKAKPTDLEVWYREEYGRAPSYSELLDALAKTPDERRRQLQKYFEPTEEERAEGKKIPTTAHRAVARLVAAGYIRIILTTNFDRLMETALRDEGIEPVVISGPEAAEGAVPLAHQRCVVVKLHGDYLNDRGLNTDEELSKYDPRMDALLDRVLDEFGLIVCGWSAEWDGALRSGFSRCKSRRFSTYWMTIAEPAERAKVLIGARAATVISIDSADQAFGRIEELLTSLAELQRPDTLTIAAAVASVKRYVAEPSSAVKFHDLLLSEAKRARDEAHRVRSNGPKFNDKTMPTYAAGYEAATEILRHLFYNAAYFAWSDDHQQAIIKAIKFMVPPDHQGGLTVELDLRKYPGCLAFYAACLGALAGEKFTLLDALFRAEVRLQQEPKTCLEAFAARDLIEITWARLLPGMEKRFTPMSDHLFKIFEPLIAEHSTEVERVFDELEILACLVYLEIKGAKPGNPLWMPVGRFWWKDGIRHSVSQEYLEAAEKKGLAWPPLTIFGSLPGRFQPLKTCFGETMRDCGRAR